VGGGGVTAAAAVAGASSVAQARRAMGRRIDRTSLRVCHSCRKRAARQDQVRICEPVSIHPGSPRWPRAVPNGNDLQGARPKSAARPRPLWAPSSTRSSARLAHPLHRAARASARTSSTAPSRPAGQSAVDGRTSPTSERGRAGFTSRDVYSRRIVGWVTADHMRAERGSDAFQLALAQLRLAPG
jgi:hypothetical protein